MRVCAGLQTLTLPLPAVVTADLRLNEPRCVAPLAAETSFPHRSVVERRGDVLD